MYLVSDSEDAECEVRRVSPVGPWFALLETSTVTLNSLMAFCVCGN